MHAPLAEGHRKEGGENEAHAALAVFVQAMLLAATLMAGHTLARRGVTWMSEAGIALLLGVGIGGLVLSPLIDTHGTFGTFVGFSKSFFFLAILPPIIFEAGWSMNVERLFANYGAIGSFAFAGTLISTFTIALLVWAAGAAGLCTALSFLEAALFGSIVSATDPVTVLAVFQRLGADANLFALVLGESLLNDAVAIVLFRSLSTFLHAPVTAGAVAFSVLMFVGVFLGSMLVGAAVAFAAAALVKTHFFRSQHMPLESSLVILFAWSSYMLADGLHLSGIVAVLFCGITSAHFVRPNMTARGQDRVGAFFKLLATLSESCVFLFIGSSLFLDQQDLGWQLLPFLLVCVVALAASRAVNVWPCAAVANYLRVPAQRIPQAHQFMLWWSGLRGAMAFAIGLQAADELPDGRGELLLSATYFIILATVLINGGACAYLLERLGLRQQQQPHDDVVVGGAGLPFKYQQLAMQQSPSGAAIPVGAQAFDAQVSEHAWDDGAAEAVTLLPLHNSMPPSGGGNFYTKAVEKLRQANQSAGLLRKLDRLDRRFLGPLFLAPGSQANSQHSNHQAGDIDEPAEAAPAHAPPQALDGGAASFGLVPPGVPGALYLT